MRFLKLVVIFAFVGSLSTASLVALPGQAIADSLSDAKSAYDSGNYSVAFRLLSPLAEQGDVEAQIKLGLMYAQGYGVPKNCDKALKWYRRAAEHDVIEQATLGLLYEQGGDDCVPKNYGEAVQWYRRAAEHGYVMAQYNLGLMYEDGRGVPQDYVQAYMWLNLAASNNAGYAMLRDDLAKRMTSKQIAEGQKLSRNWKPKLP